MEDTTDINRFCDPSRARQIHPCQNINPSVLCDSHVPQELSSATDTYEKVNVFCIKIQKPKSFASGHEVLLTHDKEREDPLQHGDDLQLFLYFGFG